MNGVTRQMVLLSLGLCLPMAVAAQDTHLAIKVPERVENDLFGPVKKIFVDDCHNQSGEHTKIEKNYDAAGNLLTQTNWDEDGEVSYVLTNGYNESGCFISQHSEDFEDGKTNDWEVILNIPKRKLAKRNRANGDITLRTYSPDKYLVLFQKMDKKKKPIRSSRFKRGPDNKETEYVSYNEKGRPKFTIKIKWNDKALLDKEGIYHHEEKVNLLNVYEYLKIDDHGNWLQRVKTTYMIEKSKKKMVNEFFTKRTIEYHKEYTTGE